jgi:SAM-dependent methyltransferase
MNWFENEKLWIDLFPIMFPVERWERADDEIEWILALAETDVLTALDLCCGPGRHSIALVKKGIQVTGVDRTAFYLEKARERARVEGVEVEWIQSDMRDFSRPESFDLALSMFTSFGYFEDEREDLRVLAALHENLREGGVLIMDMIGKECIAANFNDTSSVEEPDGTVFIERRKVGDDWSGIENEWILIRGDDVSRFRFRLSIYSGVEIRDRLRRCGFRDIRLLGDLQGAPYGLGSKRLVVVARK